ncbi:LacI family DNA-binding transcriptional regulator [Lutibaculum baratangense]|uniref:Putative transcriptional regulatory protein, LacI family n=1 Tax=Lutibaculum baratangense AMV1 TaxID=631454 RepID=V4RLM7_9HYPH|nr:LacI family DNA-binding transcriptional regulator [Lutibaculum baratangense]ESR24150.1 putative transcriptional regulatory protein, LacI family [Lutibaculum baratangense AMV1]
MSQRRGSGRPTIADVARAAGVGAITVSRAIRRPEQVSRELRERIDLAIRELNYVPDPQAQVLASGRSNVIGVILPSLTNNVYADVMQGIYDRIEGSGFQIQIANTRYSEDEEDRLLQLFAGQRPAAMLITGIDQSDATRAYLAKADFPVVQIMEHAPDPIDMLIGFSHVEAARVAVRHLMEEGSRRIGFLGARMDPRMLRRREGYRAQLREHGLYDPAREAMTSAPSSVSQGRALSGRLFDAASDTDALFCANDDLALGALFECMARGRRVPEDVAIVGFNDLEMMAAAVPAITSVQTHRYRMGKMAIDMLIDRIEEREVPERGVDLGFQLIVRESSRRG